MNVQLRDSGLLQDFIRAKANKRVLPKAQLHPELQNPIVDCDRSGFTIRSEVLGGAQDGEPNPFDVENLKAFLPEPDICTATWHIVELKQGDAFVRVPSELRFTFARGGLLVMRTQSVLDVSKLSASIPTDHSMTLDARFEAPNKLVLTQHVMQAQLPTSSKSEPDLQVEAAKAGVKWDAKASRETMLKRIEDAKAKA